MGFSLLPPFIVLHSERSMPGVRVVAMPTPAIAFVSTFATNCVLVILFNTQPISSTLCCPSYSKRTAVSNDGVALLSSVAMNAFSVLIVKMKRNDMNDQELVDHSVDDYLITDASISLSM